MFHELRTSIGVNLALDFTHVGLSLGAQQRLGVDGAQAMEGPVGSVVGFQWTASQLGDAQTVFACFAIQRPVGQHGATLGDHAVEQI